MEEKQLSPEREATRAEEKRRDKSGSKTLSKEFKWVVGIILSLLVPLVIFLFTEIAEMGHRKLGMTLALLATFALASILAVLFYRNGRKAYCDVTVVALFVVVGVCLYAMWKPHPPSDPSISPLPSSISTPVSPTTPPVLTETAPSMEPPNPKVARTEGMSTHGTQLKDVVYNTDGTIQSLKEKGSGGWISWEYVYDGSGFLYRKRNIGTADFKWSGKHMPGMDSTYCVLTNIIEDCVGFSIQYKVTEVTHGDGLGPRDIYLLLADDTWQCVGSFDYNAYESVVARVELDEPVSVKAFGTTRKNPDDSSFSVNQRMEDIWVAEYSYVELEE